MKPLAELDALCAEKVAGFTDIVQLGANPRNLAGTGRDGCRVYIPSYCTDPAAVLGLLEKEGYRCTGNRCGGTAATIVQVTNAHPEKGGPKYFEGRADDSMISADNTFALAATLALLKAHGVETE